MSIGSYDKGDVVRITGTFTNSAATAIDPTSVFFSAKDTIPDATYLTADMDDDDTSCTVASTADFPSSGSLLIGHELIKYTGKTATTFTGLTRSHAGSTAESHGAGVSVIGVTVYVYLTDAALVRTATGIYYVDLSLPAAGKRQYRFYSTGTGAAGAEGELLAKPSAF
jgi:hypothetical protein